MSFKKAASDVEFKLDDGSTIKGYDNAAISLDSEGDGQSELLWKGRLAFPKDVWEEHGHKLTAGKEYDVYLYALGVTRKDKIWILSLPEGIECSCIYVDCCGPDY